MFNQCKRENQFFSAIYQGTFQFTQKVDRFHEANRTVRTDRTLQNGGQTDFGTVPKTILVFRNSRLFHILNVYFHLTATNITLQLEKLS